MLNFSGILTIIFVLFIIRSASFVVCFPSNIDSLWHVGMQNSFPYWTKILLAVFVFFALCQLCKKLTTTPNSVKISYHVYLALMYGILVFFSRNIYEDYSYQYITQAFSIDISKLFPLIIKDWIFEAPYALWGLAFMGIVVGIFKKYNLIEYAVLLWIIPFSLINYCEFSDIFQCLMLSSIVIMLLGFKYSDGRSALWFYLLQFLTTLSLIIFIATIPGKAYCFKYFCQLLMLFYIPGFILLAFCCRKGNAVAKTTTWTIPAFTSFFLYLPLFRLPTRNCFLNTLNFVTSFAGAGKVSLVVGFIVLISFLLKKLSDKLAKISFWGLSGIIAAYYMLDSILFYYSHFRLDYLTMRWTAAMNNAFSTTLKTCLAYVTPSVALMSVLFVALLVGFLGSSRKLMHKDSDFRFNFLMLLIGASITASFMSFSDATPVILRDPVMEFVRTVPCKWLDSNTLSMDEIKSGFESCCLPLKEYKESIVGKGNQLNLILVTLESVHWKYANLFTEDDKTLPELSKFKDRIELFPYCFSVFPESTCADFSVVTGLQAPNHIYIEEKSLITYPTIVNELKKVGYNSYFFSSGSPNDGNLMGLIKTIPFDYRFYYDVSNLKNSLKTWTWGYKEESMVDEIVGYLRNNSSNQPYFLWYRTVYPHAPFEVFDSEPKHFTASEKENNNTVIDYKNSLLYLDKQLSMLVRGIDNIDKENNRKTVIALVADHGEMLGEQENNGLKGHGISVAAPLTNIPFILINPQASGLKVNRKVGSQIDVLPTLLDKLSIKPSIKRFGQGDSLLADSDIASRPVYISSMNSIALIENGYYFDFFNKKNPNAKISKLTIDSSFKPSFEKVTSWEGKDLYIKHKKTQKFFELNKQLMEKDTIE